MISTPTATLRPPRNGHCYEVVAYLRVSHDLQADNYTFETQKSRIEDKLDHHYGSGRYNLTVYQDDGLSGAFGPVASGIQNRTRPKLKQIQQEIEEGRYDCLAIYSTSRLFRSARWLFQWLEDVIIPSGIEFLSATESLDTTTSQGRAMLGMLGVMNASYREDCQQRNRDALTTRRKQGYTLGPPPYGWKRDSQEEQQESNGKRRGIVPDPATGEHLLYMKDRYLAGAGGETIARELNARDVSTPQGQGKKWISGRVLQVILNPVHAGYVSYYVDSEGKRTLSPVSLQQGQHYPNRYWDAEVYEELLEIRDRRKTLCKTNTGKPNSPDLINGIACCARCGNRLYKTGGSYRGYYCRTGRNHGTPTCPQVTAHADVLDHAVMNELHKVVSDPRMRELLDTAAQKDQDEQTGKLGKEHAQWSQTAEDVKARSNRLVDALTRNLISEDDFLNQKAMLDVERAKAQEKVQELGKRVANRTQRESWVKRVQEVLHNFPLLWEGATLDERRHLMMTLVEKLTVDREGRDALLQIKLHLLPETQVRVSFDHTRHMKIKPAGVAALTPRNLAYLHYIGQGKTNKQTAELMGTGIDCCYQFAMIVKRILGVKTTQEAYQMARAHIEQQLPFLPLKPNGRCKLRFQEVPQLNDKLKEIFPLLSQGANCVEVARRTGLTPATVRLRRTRILELFQADTIFEAAERAKAQGVLPS